MKLNEYHSYLNKSKPNKYHAKRTMVDGIRFHSKKEADYYCKLKLAQKTGEVIRFEMQVPFEICKGRKYLVDFIVYYKNNFLKSKGIYEKTDNETFRNIGFKNENYKNTGFKNNKFNNY